VLKCNQSQLIDISEYSFTLSFVTFQRYVILLRQEASMARTFLKAKGAIGLIAIAAVVFGGSYLREDLKALLAIGGVLLLVSMSGALRRL
jgi:hypothetical protein